MTHSPERPEVPIRGHPPSPLIAERPEPLTGSMGPFTLPITSPVALHHVGGSAEPYTEPPTGPPMRINVPRRFPRPKSRGKMLKCGPLVRCSVRALPRFSPVRWN